MGLWIGRAGRAVVAAGTGTGTMKLGGQWTDARRAMGRLHRCGPRRPPESSPHSPGDSSSASNRRASRPSAASRAVSVACHAAAAVLVTFAVLLALPLQAEAQKTTFVSNTGQSTDPDVREVGPHGHLWQLQAQQFRTGDNEGGYTLSAIQVRVDDFGSNSRPKVSIYTTSSGNPGSSLYVLTNPATLNDDAINSFRAPANATLEKDTNYFVVFEALGSGSNLRYDLEVTTSNSEDSGKASGWNITNSSRQRSTTATTWDNLAGKLKIAVRGTIPPAISIADASAAENAGHLMFDVTLSRSFQNTVKVDFETISGGTATEGVDYHARRTYTHVILEGDKTAQMGFALIEDTVAAAGETVKVRLSNARVVDAYGNKIKDLDITTAEATGTINAPTTSTTNVPGLTIGIRDATGDEDDGYLDFRVRLSKKYTDYVCYDFETISGGTAEEGTDYLKFPKATYWMQIGKKVDKPFVRLIDDSVNDNGETVKVKISNARLCNDASQTLSITRAEATGTIRNTDPLPRALMARFGRTAAVHVVEQVEQRLEEEREPGFRGQFGGRDLEELRPGRVRDRARDTALGFLGQLAASAAADGPDPMSGAPAAERASSGIPALGSGTETARGVLGLGGGDLLTGTAFGLDREMTRGGVFSVWGRSAQSRFLGQQGALSLDGDVRTSMLGAEYARGPLVAGMSLSHSRSLGSYEGVDGGQVASSVTGLYPWVGYKATDRITLWGVTGYGLGSLSLAPTIGSAPTTMDLALRSGLSMAMAAGGTRGELIGAGGRSGFRLAFKADALWVGTSSDEVNGPMGRLAGTHAAVTRFRTGLEGSRGFSFGSGLSLVPGVEVGLRHDGGDAERGSGVDIGGELVVSSPAMGLSAEVRMRTLLVHEAEGFRDRGVSVSLSFDPMPSTSLGLKARVEPSWGGRDRGGAEALWGGGPVSELATRSGHVSGGSVLTDLGYGMALGDRLVGTPRVGFGTSAMGREYRLGYSVGVLRGEGLEFELGIDAEHREHMNLLDNLGSAERALVARATARW